MTTVVNLVPESFYRRLLIRRRLRQWIPVWLLSITIVVTGAVIQYRGLESQRRLVAQLEARVEPIRLAEAEARQLRQELQQLSSRESLLTRLKRWDHPAQLVGIVGEAAYGEQLDVHINEIHLTSVPGHITREVILENGQTQIALEPVDRMQLRITGMGVDDLAVARFVLDLRSDAWFDNVRLRSSSHVSWMPAEVREFLVECEYQ